MMDDMTFCMDDCGVVRCERLPSNITDKGVPHSYSHLYCTEYCPLEKPQPIDVVEVVRCRECKHWWDAIPSNITLMGKRWQYCQKQKEMCPEDGFCWMGEQMDGEQDG